jgi:hypothetical protein
MDNTGNLPEGQITPKKKLPWPWILSSILVLIGASIFLAGFLKNKDPKISTQETSAISEAVEIPSEILSNKFGWLGGGQEDISYIGDVGGAWSRPHPGPFLWDSMQKTESSEFDFSSTDSLVKSQQNQNYGTLVTLWPFADWDQKNRLDSGSCAVSSEDEFLPRGGRKDEGHYLPGYRCNPKDWLSYEQWITAIVERYDGDGREDMKGLGIPIKYWEVMNEPDLQYQSDLPTGEPERLNFYKQGPSEYGELLKRTYSAIKKADPQAKVLIAGAAGGSPRMLGFYAELFRKMPEASNYFDIGNVHCISNDQETKDFNVGPYQKMLAEAGITKPIWVTEAEAFYGQSAEENYQNTKTSTEQAISAGAEKIFFTRFNFHDFRTDMSEKPKLSNDSFEDSEKKFKSIIEKYIISKPKSLTQEENQQEQKDNELTPEQKREKLFHDNAFQIGDTPGVYGRFIGETTRSCLDSNCSEQKDGCYVWNKFKDECYRQTKVCFKDSCAKSKIYCELVVVNQGSSKAVNVSFDANYVTKDGTKHLVQKLSSKIEVGHGWPFSWTYDVATGDSGRCDYGNLRVE